MYIEEETSIATAEGGGTLPLADRVGRPDGTHASGVRSPAASGSTLPVGAPSVQGLPSPPAGIGQQPPADAAAGVANPAAARILPTVQPTVKHNKRSASDIGDDADKDSDSGVSAFSLSQASACSQASTSGGRKQRKIDEVFSPSGGT